ncbi:gamma-tubulin complex component 6-like [Hibiscus syriacus]|uniref:gamma-tubulin complex component 6-like n=1 Tax=Hibiscus syriacus TaxID=106335 RepID=UPI001924CC48|nr:gamma-tubulin complex component 6-like [Hibiscus syriacus]
MAVETNFASLFEKLKVEGPWLPPPTWESIPSQSGPLPPLPASQSPISSSSSVYEATLVRLALNALQGVESSLFSIEKISAAFCYDPADRTFHQTPSLWYRSSSTHALGKILKSIGCSGFLVFLLHKFVDYFTNLNLNGNSFSPQKGWESSQAADNQNHGGRKVQAEEGPKYSLVNQAFSVAVGKVLEGYICALDTLYESINVRRSSKSSEVSAGVSSGCLTSVVYSEITLLEVYLHTKELRTQIEALGNICNLHNLALCFSESSFEELSYKATLGFHNFFRGGDLLSYLYTQLKVADPAHGALLKFLFLRSCEPYCEFIRSWIFKAEINDPYKEFVVEYIDTLQHSSSGKAGISTDFPVASITERNGAAVPCFLKDVLIPLIRAGQQLQVLMKLLELRKYVDPGDYTYSDFLPCWSGFAGSNPLYASSITFGKENIEPLVLMRSSYYERMEQKLENLLTGLEFNYQQVISHCADADIISLVLAEALKIHSQWMTNWLLIRQQKEVSLMCLLTLMILMTLVQKMDPIMKLISLNHLSVHLNYFSALSFSVSTPVSNSMQQALQNGKSEYMESSIQAERTGGLGSFVGSEPGGIYEHLHLESNWLCAEAESANILPSKGFPVNVILEKIRENVTQFFDKFVQHFNESIAINNTSAVDLSNEGRLEKESTSGLFQLQQFELTCNGNLLSKNPMATNIGFLGLMNKPGDSSSIPCFDFSSVDDPCKVYVKRLASGVTLEFPENTYSVTNGTGNWDDKQGYGGDVLLIDNSKGSHAVPTSELKKINQDVISTTVSGGNYWESLLGSSSTLYSSSTGDIKLNTLSTFEIPLDFVIDKCLLQEILLQYNYVSKLTIKILEEGFDLQEHLLALRRYHFMELADWADLFIMSLSRHKWCVTEVERRLSEIQGLLELSVQRSSCERDHHKDRLFVYEKGHGMMPLSTSTIGVHSFYFLGLGYRVDWPASIILTPGALKIYSNIFNFLIQLKLAVFSLTDVWCSLKDVVQLICQKRHRTLHEREVGHFNMLMKLRHQVNHFVSTLQQYVQSQLSHVSWCKFLHSSKHKVKDMMDLELVHMAYLTDSLNICFLSDETKPIASTIENILQCALDFRSCLTGGIWNTGHAEDDLLDKLSRINVSQVLSIKEKFEKNLKELHLLYLKSPKHGESGLSCFWGYLNYNDYSNENEMSYYAFSI